MPDVPFYVAIVAAGASVISGAVPLAIGWARDAGRQKRAEAKALTREQKEIVGDRRELCVNLLSLARHFRVLVENVYDSRGPVLDSDVEQVRESVADIASQADKVEFNVPKAGAAAVSLANEARKLALTAEEKNREHGSSLVSDDFRKFDDCIEAFKDSARSALEELQERTG
jgi:uncharacterized linocin/CFP29 family protein